MTQPLPRKDIRFTNDVEIREFMETSDYAESRFAVQVELHYPIEMGEKTKNFPLCPENKKQTFSTSLNARFLIN